MKIQGWNLSDLWLAGWGGPGGYVYQGICGVLLFFRESACPDWQGQEEPISDLYCSERQGWNPVKHWIHQCQCCYLGCVPREGSYSTDCGGPSKLHCVEGWGFPGMGGGLGFPLSRGWWIKEDPSRSKPKQKLLLDNLSLNRVVGKRCHLCKQILFFQIGRLKRSHCSSNFDILVKVFQGVSPRPDGWENIHGSGRKNLRAWMQQMLTILHKVREIGLWPIKLNWWFSVCDVSLQIKTSYFLVSNVDIDYINGDLFSVFAGLWGGKWASQMHST
jgi:hypothetical protein